MAGTAKRERGRHLNCPRVFFWTNCRLGETSESDYETRSSESDDTHKFPPELEGLGEGQGEA